MLFYYIIFYSILLYYILFYYIISYYIIIYYVILYYVILYYIYHIISYWYIPYQEAKSSGKLVLSAFRADGRSVPPAWHRDAHWMMAMRMSSWNRLKTLRNPGWWWMLTGTSRNAVQTTIIGIWWDMSDSWCWWIHHVCLFFRRVTSLQIVDVNCASTMKHLRHFLP